MKIVLYKILTLLSRLFYFFRNVTIINSLIYCNRISSGGSNRVILKNAQSGFSRYYIEGTNNSVEIHGHVSFVNIRVSGENNHIKIEGGCRILHSKIFIKGSDCNVNIGTGTTVGSMNMVCMGESNAISIGENCMLAEEVEIWASDAHPIFNTNRDIINISKPIIIGNHVWIGKQTAILKGVVIGENSVVGMRSIVTKNIASNTLNVGAPSRAIKREINWSRCFITEFDKNECFD